MKFAVVGLAYSHPYSYVRILLRDGHSVAYAWDDDPVRLQEFAGQFGAVPVGSVQDIPVGEIDGVLATARIPERIEHVVRFLEAGVPTYSSKPAATSMKQLERILDTVRKTKTPWFSTSVLRYAPALLTLKGHLDQGRLGTLISARATSAHYISHYMQEPGIWQDDPQRGGGTIVNMGIHALEMLSVLIGSKIGKVWCQAGKRIHRQSLSEDTALIFLEWKEGLGGVLEVPCGVKGESFGVEMYGSEAILGCSIPKGDVRDASGAALGDADPLREFGYVGTMGAFVEMCRSRVMPVEPEETGTLARVLLAARDSAASGRPVILS